MNIFDRVKKYFNDADYSPCKGCEYHAICQGDDLVCLPAILGIMAGKKWEPKEPKSKEGVTIFTSNGLIIKIDHEFDIAIIDCDGHISERLNKNNLVEAILGVR